MYAINGLQNQTLIHKIFGYSLLGTDNLWENYCSTLLVLFQCLALIAIFNGIEMDENCIRKIQSIIRFKNKNIASVLAKHGRSAIGTKTTAVPLVLSGLDGRSSEGRRITFVYEGDLDFSTSKSSGMGALNQSRIS